MRIPQTILALLLTTMAAAADDVEEDVADEPAEAKDEL